MPSGRRLTRLVCHTSLPRIWPKSRPLIPCCAGPAAPFLQYTSQVATHILSSPAWLCPGKNLAYSPGSCNLRQHFASSLLARSARTGQRNGCWLLATVAFLRLRPNTRILQGPTLPKKAGQTGAGISAGIAPGLLCLHCSFGRRDVLSPYHAGSHATGAAQRLESPTAMHDGAGRSSSPDWSRPRTKDYLGPLRSVLLDSCNRRAAPQRLLARNTNPSFEPLFDAAEVQQARALLFPALGFQEPPSAGSPLGSAFLPRCIAPRGELLH